MAKPLKECPALPDGFEFHHLRYATKTIEKERNQFELLGYEPEGNCFQDPIQGVTGCFFVGAGPRIELLENTPGSLTLTSWLSTGIKVYHFGYLVADLASALKWAHTLRAKI